MKGILTMKELKFRALTEDEVLYLTKQYIAKLKDEHQDNNKIVAFIYFDTEEKNYILKYNLNK